MLLLQGKQVQRSEMAFPRVTAKSVTKPRLAFRSKPLFMVLFTAMLSGLRWRKKSGVSIPRMGILGPFKVST